MLREFELRRIQQRETANTICKSLRPVCITALEQKGVVKKHPVSVIFSYLAGPSKWTAGTVYDEEKYRQWGAEFPVDIDDEKTVITIKGFGGKSPSKTRRIFIYIGGASHFLELSSEGEGTLWNKIPVGKKGGTRNVRGDTPPVAAAQLYKEVLTKLQQQRLY